MNIKGYVVEVDVGHGDEPVYVGYVGRPDAPIGPSIIAKELEGAEVFTTFEAAMSVAARFSNKYGKYHGQVRVVKTEVQVMRKVMAEVHGR